jgi:hypothetical protein
MPHITEELRAEASTGAKAGPLAFGQEGVKVTWDWLVLLAHTSEQWLKSEGRT